MRGSRGSTPGDDVTAFAPTGGQASGVAALAICLAVLVGAFFAEDTGVAPWAGSAAVFVAVLSYAALLRPRISLDRDCLHLRGMLETVALPLARIEKVAVVHVLSVVLDDGKRYVSPAAGRSRRQERAASREGGARRGLAARLPQPDSLSSSGPSARRPTVTVAEYVESTVRQRSLEARQRVARTAADAPTAPVRRRPAWVEIALLVVSALVTLLLLVVA